MKCDDIDTEAWVVSWPAFASQVTWHEFSLRLALQPRQAAQVRALLYELNEEYLHIFSAPAVSGPSPVEHLIQACGGHPGGVDENLEPSLRKYAACAIHAGAKQDYLRVFREEHLDFHKRIVRLFDGPQRATLTAMALGSLLALELEGDPLRDYLRGRLHPILDSPAAVCGALDLDEERSERVRQRLTEMREEIATLLQRDAQSGGESPVQLYARLKTEGHADAPLRFMQYMRREKDHISGTSYEHLLSAAAARATADVAGLLGPEKAARLKALGGVTMQCRLPQNDPVDLAVLAAQPSFHLPDPNLT